MAEPEIRIKGDVGQYTDASYWLGDIEVAEMELHEHSEPIDQVVSLLPKFVAEEGIASRKSEIAELARFSRENRSGGMGVAIVVSVSAAMGEVSMSLGEATQKEKLSVAAASLILALSCVMGGIVTEKRAQRRNAPRIDRLQQEVAIIKAAPKADE